MPRYKVLEPGFIGNIYYKPTKRNVVITDEPLDPVPRWLEKMKEETAAQKKARLKKEKAEAKKTAEKQESDKTDIDAVNFIEPPHGAAKAANVETLG